MKQIFKNVLVSCTVILCFSLGGCNSTRDSGVLDESANDDKLAYCDATKLVNSSIAFHKGEVGIEDLLQFVQKHKGDNYSGKTRDHKPNILDEEQALSLYSSKFFIENNISIQDLDEYVEKNPDKVFEFIEASFTLTFVEYYDKLMASQNIEEYLSIVHKVQKDDKVSSMESVFLVLLTSQDDTTETRSLGCKARRYWKLTKIAVGSIGESLLNGADAGVEYATNHLQKMRDSGKYNC